MREKVRVLKGILPAWLQRLLRRLLAVYRAKTYRSRTVTHKIFGQDMVVWIGDAIAEQWYGRDLPLLPSFMEVIRRTPSNREVRMFYIGAHYCVYAIALSRIVGPRLSIVALEANPHHVHAAIKNCEINGCGTVKVVHGAVSDLPGTLAFTLGHNVAVGEDGVPTQTVRAYTIDELAAIEGQPDVVIVDVEGFEQKAMLGAKRAIDRGAVWCIEVHSGAQIERYGGSLEGILRAMGNGRYDYLMAKDYGAEPARKLDTSDDLTRARFHLIAVPVRV